MKLLKLIRQGSAVMLSLSLLTASLMIPSSQASAAKIKLNKTKLKLTVGSTYKLKINQKKAKVKWSSSKKKVASVNSKGKVKAKKAGTAVISATVKGKKYKCKVTVKKAKNTKPSNTPKSATKVPTTRPNTSVSTPSQTPFVIPTPIPVATPGQPANSETPVTTPAPTAVATKGPVDLDPLEQNITLQTELLANNILITATNHNTIWVDDVIINYDIYDTENNNIATGYTTLNSMQPEETMYVTLPLSDQITAINETASVLYANVSEAYDNTKYLDLKDSITFTTDEITEQSSSLIVDITNHSKYNTDISYTVFFYDTNQQMVDAYASTLDLRAKDTETETIDFPITEENDTTSILSTNYKIVYTAHGTEDINELTPYIDNISLMPEKTQHTLLVAIKNNNTTWLSSFSLEYHLYDTEDKYLTSEEQYLLSMKPGETQYITINVDPDTIQAIDLDNSYADINVEPDNGDFNYNTTTMVSANVAAIEGEENNFEITITNNSTHDTEGSYVIYFYDAKKKILGAQQYTYALMSKDSETNTVVGPVSYDENDTPIYAVSNEVKIQASHTL